MDMLRILEKETLRYFGFELFPRMTVPSYLQWPQELGRNLQPSSMGISLAKARARHRTGCADSRRSSNRPSDLGFGTTCRISNWNYGTASHSCVSQQATVINTNLLEQKQRQKDLLTSVPFFR